MCLCTGMALSICSRTLRPDDAKKVLWKVAPNDTNTVTIISMRPISTQSWTISPRCWSFSMSRNPPTRAVLTIAIDHLHAIPAEFGPTLGAMHVTTPSILLNALRAIWTLLGLFLDNSETLILLLEPVFDASLVL
jgi:hypothetical protein